MKKVDEVLAKGISAIIPDYQPNIGNITRIFDKDGLEYVEKKRVKAILNRLAAIYFVDLAALRKRYSAIIHQRNIIPIPICEHMILIPFKMRKPIIENDGSLGYINHSSIKSIRKTKDNKLVDVELNNGRSVKCMASYKTALKHMRNTEIVKEHYCKLHLKTSSLKSINDVYLEYEKPATKTDIALLNMQVAELAKYVKDHIAYTQNIAESVMTSDDNE